MTVEQIFLATPDGICPSYLFKAEQGGRGPGVIFCMDGFGIRPALFQMAQRLADFGYVVLLPDLFYRAGSYETLNPSSIVKRGNIMSTIGHLLQATDNVRAARDAGPFIDFLDRHSDVSGRQYGVVGYCMGGGIALSIAGSYPERIAAAASFHGGNLATDDDKSPHLLANNIQAQIYIGVADSDPWYPRTMADRLEESLGRAQVSYRSEVYRNAPHGFAISDVPTFNPDACEKHWQELAALLSNSLPRPHNG